MAPTPRPLPAVRPVARPDVADVAAALARAFEDDPVMMFLLPDEVSRLRRLTAMFSILTKHVHLKHEGSEVGLRDGTIAAGALWDPPGHWRVPLTSQLRQAIPLVRAFGTRLPTILRALGTIEQDHPKEHHWYLATLGTDPSAQGLGLGGALLRSRLDRCDEEGVPAYLESSKESNIPYYERFGFKVTGELQLPGAGAPPVWPMWRDPDRKL
ncbi:GNAT family N-acetyltransferase [Actinomadura barringtoniae]|uniref:GNAT family N-acetyltransferase n=1 Tax=Actinomadura barringtoniae TaxID=1427535 RepID=A0A939PDT6_9ACTN|nr:GNAT family N-acetyltransferase [Actinomadura barringtoniae]MBO2450987.1 GNAT family N-acetyltransferase [Actinomadura barringtoniae]